MQQEQQLTITTERLMLLVLAAIHFTAVVDFLIIMPLGPQYMRVFDITSAQFGLMVSAYGLSAGLASILLGVFLGRTDRKKVLLGVYAGFSLGTLFCALAPNYPLLLASRAVTGGFGGVLGALIFAIVADAIPEERRGSAMGLVMSSVAAGFVFRVPIGVFLAAHLGWQMPFFALAGLSFSICGVAYLGGLIIGKSTTGEMTHFPLVGGVATACALLSICLARSIKIPIAEIPGVNARPGAR